MWCLQETKNRQRKMTDIEPDWKHEARGILHDCDRSARYHTLRRAFYSRCHRWMMAFIVFGGSAAVAILSQKLLEGNPSWLIFTMLIPTLLGAIDLVWNPSDRSRDHEVLARKFYWVARTIDEQNATGEMVRDWKISLLNVYEDEPDVFHALNAECYNAATRAVGFKEIEKYKRISWLQRRFRHWVRYSAEDFPLKRTN